VDIHRTFFNSSNVSATFLGSSFCQDVEFIFAVDCRLLAYLVGHLVDICGM